VTSDSGLKLSTNFPWKLNWLLKESLNRVLQERKRQMKEQTLHGGYSMISQGMALLRYQ